MKIAAIIGFLVIVVLLVIFVLNRPQLNVVAANIPEGFPPDGFSHEVFESLLKTYVDSSGQVDYDSWHQSNADIASLGSYLAAVSRYSPEEST